MRSPTTRTKALLGGLVAFLLLASFLGAQTPIQVTIGEKPYTNAGLDEVAKQIEAYRARVPAENPSEAQKALGAAIDQAQGRLQGLRDLMTRIDEFPARLAERETETRKATGQLDDLKKASARSALPETIDDAAIRSLISDAEKAVQAIGKAELEIERLKKAKTDRAAEVSSATKRIEDLQREKNEIITGLDREDLTPEARAEFELRLVRNEIDTRRVELLRDRNADLDKLDDATLQRTQAQLELAKLEKQVADGRLATARERLKEALRDAVTEAEGKAEELENRARGEEFAPARLALRLEALAWRLEAQRGREERDRTEFEARDAELGQDLERVKSQEEEIDSLFPEGEELNAVRAKRLTQKLRITGRQLPRMQREFERLTGRVAELQSDLDAKLVTIQGFKRLFDTAIDDDLADEAPALEDEDSARFVSLREEFRDAVAKIEAEEKRDFFSTDWKLASAKRSFDAAETRISTLLDARIKILDATAKAARESLQRLEQIVAMLADRETRLEALSFWLRVDPPFSSARRDVMAGELRTLRESLGASFRGTSDHLRNSLGGAFGIAGLVCLALGVALAIFRRVRSDPSSRIERLVATRRDPLVELAIVAGWLVFETGHHLLFMLGLGLIWRTPLPDDPLACAASAFFLVAALRLAATRLVSYLSEASDDVDGALALEARRFLRFAVIGFFVTVPPILFFEKSGAGALAEASRLAATLWALLVVLRLAFRRHLLVLLVPVADGSKVGRGLRGLVRLAWPLVVIFVGSIVILQFRGYQNASLFLVERTLLAAALLVAVNLIYQFGSALIESRTTSVIEHSEQSEHTQEFMTRARQRQLEAYNRLLSLPFTFCCLIGGAIGVAMIFGLSGARWDRVSASNVFKETLTAEGKLIPGLTWGDLAIAVLIFMIGYVIARIVRDLIVVGIATPQEDRRGGRYAVGTLVFYLLMTITILMGLRTMQVDLSAYGWLLATAGVGIGFGLQEILANFICGLILFVERPVQVGDIVTIGDVEGDVRRISIRSTIVRTRDGVSIILPNRKLIEEDVVNWSHSDAKTRIKIDVGVAYGSDVPLVKMVLLEVADREGRVLKRPRPEVDFVGFGESELSFQLLCWLATPDITIQRRVKSDLNSAIDASFRRHGVEIPFPQRDLHIRDTPRTIAKKRSEAEKDRKEALEGEAKEGSEP